jgi:thiamine-monophosphate kinase
LQKGQETLNEHQLIKEYFSDVGSAYLAEQGIKVPIGDDAAIISLPREKESVISVDTSISGVHFLETMEPSDIAYRSVSVALSDLAACGATPAWFTLAISIKEYDLKWLSDFKQGLKDISNEFKIPLIGGDTTKGHLSITIQVGGYIDPGKTLTRKGANVGDLIYITGYIGEAMAELDQLKLGKSSSSNKNRYLRPKIRFGVAERLLGIASSAIDISDGVFQDLDHLCKESKVGAEIFLKKIPTFLSKALSVEEINRGDDYEILFTSAESNKGKINDIAREENLSICEVGLIKKGSKVEIISAEGKLVETPSGYQHF